MVADVRSGGRQPLFGSILLYGEEMGKPKLAQFEEPT
jgi:hypothetical protein